MFTHLEAVMSFNFMLFNNAGMWKNSASRWETIDLDEIVSYFYREMSICNCVEFQLKSAHSSFDYLLLSEVWPSDYFFLSSACLVS